MDEIIFVDSKGKEKMKLTGQDLVISDDKKTDEDKDENASSDRDKGNQG